MYTYDEWGNSVLHIQTGTAGIKLLQGAGFKNTMTKEEYSRHMKSHYKLQKESSERLWKSLMRILGKI